MQKNLDQKIYEFNPHRCTLDNHPSQGWKRIIDEKGNGELKEHRRSLFKVGISDELIRIKEKEPITPEFELSAGFSSYASKFDERGIPQIPIKERKKYEEKGIMKDNKLAPIPLRSLKTSTNYLCAETLAFNNLRLSPPKKVGSPGTPGISAFLNLKDKARIDVRNSLSWKDQLQKQRTYKFTLQKANT